MRLLLDEHLDKIVAARLRSRSFDVVAVTEDKQLVGASDRHVLERAVQDRRAVATYNVRDFRILANERLLTEDHHFGLVLSDARRLPQGTRYVGALIEALTQLLEERPADDALVDREIWL